MLNCGPTGSETLKNLVLGGVGSITIVDGSKVELGDLGNNFMGKFSNVSPFLFHLFYLHFFLIILSSLLGYVLG